MTPITLCSLALCLWGYQTGAWLAAIPMAMALEAHSAVKPRGTLNKEAFRAIHLAGAILWVLAICYIPAYSPTSIPYAVTLHLLKCLPVGLFPLILAQVYTTNFQTIYRDRVFSRSGYRLSPTFNLAYPYFGSCLLAASTTGGNPIFFLTAATVLMAGVLGLKRSRRFGAGTFCGLMALALTASIIGTNQLHWLAANFRLSPDLFRPLIEKIASLAPQQDHPAAKKVSQTDAAQNRDRLGHTRLKLSPATAPQIPVPQAGAAQTGTLPDSLPSSQNIKTALQAAQEMAQRTGALPPGSLSSTAEQAAQNALAAASAPSQDNPSSPSAAQTAPTKSSPAASSATVPQNSAAAASPAQSTQSSQSGPATSSTESAPVSSAPSSPNLLDRAPSSPSQQSEQQSKNSKNLDNTPSSAPDTIAQADTQQPNAPKTESPKSYPSESVNSSPAQSSQTGSVENKKQTASEASSTAAGSQDRVNPQNSRTQIGHQGTLQLSDTVLFQVAPISTQPAASPELPIYIREATYNQYRSGTWQALQPQFTPRSATSGRSQWVFRSHTPTTSSVRISARLQAPEGILKLPIGTSRIDRLAVNQMQVNQYGTVSIKGKPGQLVYDVQFDPSYSPESPPTVSDREIPAAEQPALQKALSSLNLKGKSIAQVINAVEAYFQTGFSYSLTLPPPQQGTTPLSSFLLDRRVGHCEYFASATALLLRAAGIPTRYAVGYKVDEYSPSEQQYVARASDAHAWVMAYVNGAWTKIDTTPAGTPSNEKSPLPAPESLKPDTHRSLTSRSGINKPKVQTETTQTRPTADLSQQNADDQTGPQTIDSFKSLSKTVSQSRAAVHQAIQTVSQKLSQTRSALLNQLRKQSSSQLWGAAVMALGTTIILLTMFFAWRMARGRNRSPLLQQRRKTARLDATVDGFDSEFYTLEQRLGQWGLERQPSETARQWMIRLQQKLPAAQIEGLDRILELHYRYRFDPQGLAVDDRAELKTLIQDWLLKSAA